MKLQTNSSGIGDEFSAIFSESPPPFAIVYRPEINPERLDLFIGDVIICERLSDINTGNDNFNSNNGYDVITLIPYCQIKEKNFDCVDDQTPLIAIKIKKQAAIKKQEILSRIKNLTVNLKNEHYDTSDEVYKEKVRSIISEEISKGAGANFVLKRKYSADIESYSNAKALSIFKNLLGLESGVYWTFIIYTGEQILVGATPERHISLKEQIATMNPISGTYRYPKSGLSVGDFLTFLNDKKETEELYMVVDEELKMMSRLCESGGTVYGPYIKEMSRLAHTEYLIKGKTTLPPQKILQETLFAPTVTGSPLENACRVIKKYEPDGRGYYSGVIALISQQPNKMPELDSSIIIRTAQIDKYGKFSISVGSTLVRHSDPESECMETKAKATGLLAAINSFKHPSAINAEKRKHNINNNILVLKKLKTRNKFIAKFWRQERGVPDKNIDLRLKGFKTLIIDAEDTFTSMLHRLLQCLGLDITLKLCNEYFNINDYDLCILGPGPGNPNNGDDHRVSKLKRTLTELLDKKHKFIAICLSHQILCSHLGLTVSLKKQPNQGTQKAINLFGSIEKVGFYNSYSGISTKDIISIRDVGNIEISRDPHTYEIHALRGNNFSSMQFHPESIFTERGIDILRTRLLEIINNDK